MEKTNLKSRDESITEVVGPLSVIYRTFRVTTGFFYSALSSWVTGTYRMTDDWLLVINNTGKIVDNSGSGPMLLTLSYISQSSLLSSF